MVVSNPFVWELVDVLSPRLAPVGHVQWASRLGGCQQQTENVVVGTFC